MPTNKEIELLNNQRTKYLNFDLLVKSFSLELEKAAYYKNNISTKKGERKRNNFYSK